jgi:hypothetical protein
MPRCHHLSRPSVVLQAHGQASIFPSNTTPVLAWEAKMVLDLRESLLDLISEGKDKLVIDARMRSPLSSTGAAEHPKKKMASSANNLLVA